MKGIVIKTKEGGVKAYIPGGMSNVNLETGESTPIEISDEEQKQRCYQMLIDDVRREEFEKALISLISNYEKDIDTWTNIHIEMSFQNGRHLEMNVSNPDRFNIAPERKGKKKID